MSKSGQTLLVEIRTEELPPLLLWDLADDFPNLLLEQLRKAGFANDNSRRAQNGDTNKKLATPRRLAALLENILAQSPPEDIVRHGPQLAACYDSSGAPTKALSGFMRSVGVTSEDDLHQAEEKGKTYIAWRGQKPARLLSDELALLVENTLLALRAPRLMRWGDNDFRFVRPVRGVLLLHGNKVIAGEIMGVAAGQRIKGRSIMPGSDIKINNVEEYESALEEGHVIVDMDERLQTILKFLPQEAGAFHKLLLLEVVAMCECPAVIRRKIDEEFMTLPRECIIECMTKQQRAFYAVDINENLLRNYYIVVDNDSENNELMRRGYDAVLRARLCDVQFYYNEDRKVSLSDYVEKLKDIAFHSKIGTQYERIERACKIGDAFLRNRDDLPAEADFHDAACKYLASLPSLMVGEYPELQEAMANIYFYEKEDEHKDMMLIAIWFDIEKIVGMLGVGEKPSGSKDPHGLRRCAQNIAAECLYNDRLDSDMREVIAVAVESFGSKIADVREEVYDFILDRMKFVMSPEFPSGASVLIVGFSTDIKNSVLSQRPDSFRDVMFKIMAVGEFAKTSAAEDLSAADKRAKNILRKSSVNVDDFPAPDKDLFLEDEELTLWQYVKAVQDKNDKIFRSEFGGMKFTHALKNLAAIAPAVNAFFEKVRVNVEDEKIRNNRFALLAQLRKLLNQVADISYLSR